MTGKSDFTEEEWKTVLEGPPSAGLIVAAASKGGTFRESFAMAKAYAEARKEHGQSELLDEIESAKPEVDRHGIHSFDELKAKGLQHLRDAIAVLDSKATPDELAAYRRFVLSVAEGPPGGRGGRQRAGAGSDGRDHGRDGRRVAIVTKRQFGASRIISGAT